MKIRGVIDRSGSGEAQLILVDGVTVYGWFPYLDGPLEGPERTLFDIIWDEHGPCVCNVGVQECPAHPGRLWDQDKKIAFRKAWDDRVREGSA